jgi:hypothetical protein
MRYRAVSRFVSHEAGRGVVRRVATYVVDSIDDQDNHDEGVSYN